MSACDTQGTLVILAIIPHAIPLTARLYPEDVATEALGQPSFKFQTTGNDFPFYLRWLPPVPTHMQTTTRACCPGFGPE